jgi:hypothetical protein
MDDEGNLDGTMDRWNSPSLRQAKEGAEALALRTSTKEGDDLVVTFRAILSPRVPFSSSRIAVILLVEQTSGEGCSTGVP